MSTTGEKVKVLVVEDEPSIAAVCRRALADGFEVDVAPNGRVARDMLAGKDYRLLLLDIRTPEMNGQQLYHYLEAERPELAGRVIFTTGDVMAGDVQDFIRQTGMPFLPKPFTPKELLEVVKTVAAGLNDGTNQV